MPRRLTNVDFVKRSRAVHGKRYGYENVVYAGIFCGVNILCPLHGSFRQIPDHHMRGRGCPKCGNISIANSLRKTTDQFIADAVAVHGKRYDYQYVAYTDDRTVIKIKCRHHGVFLQRPGNHLIGQGCPKCGLITIGNKKRKSTTEFVKRANAVHRQRYLYHESVYAGVAVKLTIICKKHGRFEQYPRLHFLGQGCPRCCESKGELGVMRILAQMKRDKLIVDFDRQVRHPAIRKIRLLVFDFAVHFVDGTLGFIEYQGEHHYKGKNCFGATDWKTAFDQLKNRDKIKRLRCKKLGISLLNIPYWRLGNAQEMIHKWIQTRKRRSHVVEARSNRRR